MREDNSANDNHNSGIDNYENNSNPLFEIHCTQPNERSCSMTLIEQQYLFIGHQFCSYQYHRGSRSYLNVFIFFLVV